MEEKLKNSKVKILIIIVAVVLAIMAVSFISKEIRKAQIRAEMKDTISNIKDTVSSIHGNSGISDIQDNNKIETEEEKVYMPVEMGQKVTVEDYLEYSFITSKFTKKIQPSKPDSYHHYFESEGEDNILLAVKVKIKNLQTEEIDSLPGATLVYDGKYKYDCSLIVEEDDGSDLSGYDFDKYINPLKTRTYYYYADIPKEIKEDSKPITLRIDLQDNSYELKIR